MDVDTAELDADGVPGDLLSLFAVPSHRRVPGHLPRRGPALQFLPPRGVRAQIAHHVGNHCSNEFTLDTFEGDYPRKHVDPLDPGVVREDFAVPLVPLELSRVATSPYRPSHSENYYIKLAV